MILDVCFCVNVAGTGTPKKSKETVLRDWSEKSNVKEERVNYTADFVVDSNFGVPGAITVINKHHQEFFMESITIEGFACGPVHFPCSSWVQSTTDLPGKRIFFSNQVILLCYNCRLLLNFCLMLAHHYFMFLHTCKTCSNS